MANNVGRMTISRKRVSIVCARPIFVSINPLLATTNWRAVCGRTARTVLREGSRAKPDFPTPYRNNHNLYEAEHSGAELPGAAIRVQQ